MRIPLIIEKLKTICKIAKNSSDKALLYLGTVEFLLNFLQETAEKSGNRNMTAVRERIWDIQNAFYWQAGLINDDEVPKVEGDPWHFAFQALNTLPMQTLLGDNPLFLQRRISRKFGILEQ